MGGLPGPLGTPSAPTESESSPLDPEPRGRWAGLCHSPRVCWTLTGSCLWNQKRKLSPWVGVTTWAARGHGGRHRHSDSAAGG